MKAIEFTTKAKNGVIEIPKEYLTTLHNEFRVIILVGPEVVVDKKRKKLSSIKIKTKGLVFDRDEANER
ncbi:MAG: hypothetical protein WC707_00710 [Candidatus Babeliaceae bacterium]|jgi:hypothetical protein